MSQYFTVPSSLPMARFLPSLEIANDHSGPAFPLKTCRGWGIFPSLSRGGRRNKAPTAPSVKVSNPAAAPSAMVFHQLADFFLGHANVSDDLSSAQKCSSVSATSRADW